MYRTLITQLSANTRKILAKCRALAMYGQFQNAVDILENTRNQYLTNTSSLSAYQITIECVALSLLNTEILHLNFKDEEAYSILRSEILTKLEKLPYEMALAINQNRNEVEFSLFNPETVRQQNLSYDERELMQLKFWNPEAVVYAFEYASKGEHYESLPAFWKELESTYKSGSWLAYRQAAKRLAIEFTQLGFVTSAVYQILISQDVKLIEDLGQQLLFSRNPDLVKLSIDKLLVTANLKKHTFVASKFINVVADAIPDSQISEVFNWLILRGELIPQNWKEEALSISVWEALFALKRRLTSEQGRKVVEISINHPMWEEPNRLREKLLINVNAAVPHLPADELLELAKKSLPAATNKQDQVDYPDALNLVCHIAEYSEESKELIGNTLYSETNLGSFELGQLAPFFNRRIKTEVAEQIAFEVAADIRLQVQRVTEENSPSRPMSIIASLSSQGGGENTTIHIYVFSAIDSLLEYRKFLSEAAIEELVNAILDMIREPENIPANKMGLLNRLVKLADCLTEDLAEKIFETLLPIIEGSELELPNILQGYGDPNNPLNPFKINVQTLEEVQSGALYTLAKIEENMSGVYGDKLLPLLEKAMTSPHSVIRKFAFTSLKKVNLLGEVTITNLLIGARDPDPLIAEQAYLALAQNEYLQLSEAEWLSLAYAISLGFNSLDLSVRRSAAYVIAKRQSQWEQTNIAEKMQELKAAFANDICYSVRATALQSDPGNEN